MQRARTSVALLVVALLLAPGTALAQDTAPPDAPAPAPAPAPPDPVPPAPAPPAPAPPAPPDVTLEELAKQAEEAQKQVDAQQAELAAEQRRLDAAEQAAAVTLEGYQAAQREADLAARAAAEQQVRLQEAALETAAARKRLADYVGRLYRDGMGTARMSAVASLLGTDDADTFLSGLALAERVGANKGGEMVELAEAEAAQHEAAEQARAAQQASVEATARAAAAKELADRIVSNTTRDVLGSHEALLRTQGAAAAVAEQEAQRQALMAKADEVARQRAAIPFVSLDGVMVPRPNADCRGGDVAGYPNGLLPAAALCPLWGTNGHMLRADAAAAFDEMSRAYASVFGVPICVTDSYRTLQEQVAVKAAKPTLAAQPGTSNHGWAQAVDLCDGIQRFGTPTHDWMRRNSLRYGWFLPSWAHETGSLPEPWHWEYAGSRP